MLEKKKKITVLIKHRGRGHLRIHNMQIRMIHTQIRKLENQAQARQS